MFVVESEMLHQYKVLTQLNLACLCVEWGVRARILQGEQIRKFALKFHEII